MQEIDTCPVCNKNTFDQHLSCVDYTVTEEKFSIISCKHCGLAITSPRPKDQDIGNYYLSENYISHTGKAQTLVDKIYVVARKFTLKQKLKLISKFKETRGKILDYGCGTGEFLNTCKKSGYQITGVEPSKIAREKAEELIPEKILSTLDQVSNNHFDIITLWHVLEHVPDLDSTLKTFFNILTSDGIIFIAVPNHKSYDAEHYQEFWAGYDVPRHLWHFSPENMKKLLAKNSLKLLAIKPMKLDAFYISLLSEKYRNPKNGALSRMIKAFIYGVISNLKAHHTGNYSSLIYIAKK